MCEKRHNFDVTREGYLSLLHGRGNYQQIGDDTQMVQARIRVHRLSPYADLAAAIAEMGTKDGPVGRVLDIGCGDGFFLDHLCRASRPHSMGVGIDISKGALARAAKGFPELLFARTDAARDRLPFADSSFDLVLSVFAPRPIDEIGRVLQADGRWLIVTATQDHLKEVRRFLPLAEIGTGKLDGPRGSSYAVLASDTCSRELVVSHQDLVSVIEMSPSIYRLRREHGEKWNELVPNELKTTFSFSLTLLGKGLR